MRINFGAAGNHGNDGVRHQQTEADVHDDETDDRRHAQKMHQARGLETAEQRQQFRKLDRLPDRKPGNDGQYADTDDADIKQLLHRVVAGGIVVREAKQQRGFDGRNQFAPADRQQHAPEAPGGEPIGHVGNAVEHDQPHAEEMPLQPVLRPFADDEEFGEMQPAKNYLVVVYFPAAADHDEHGERIDPMHDPDRGRVEFFNLGCHGGWVLFGAAMPRKSASAKRIVVASSWQWPCGKLLVAAW